MKKYSVLGTLLLVFGACATSFGQTPEREARIAVASGVPKMTQRKPITIDTASPVQMTVGSSVVFDARTGGVVGAPKPFPKVMSHDNAIMPLTANANNIDGLDTLATFDGAFAAQNGPSTGQVFRFTMIGNHPQAGGATNIPAPLDEVSLTLLNADGSVFAVVPYDPFESATLSSPNFKRSTYASGMQIQFADAVQRAEFFNRMKANWHTNLVPAVVNRVNITVPRFVNVQLSDGTVVQARSYFTGTAGDGSTFVLMLDLLFNFFFDNEVVNEINLGNFTTGGLNMTLWPNTFLFSLNTANPNSPGGCCVLGFHTYFADSSAIPQPRWVTLYASWISPGLFGAGFQDITGLSHETQESFDDPFVDNAAPVWQFPGQPANSTACQNNLEDGDPVEVLANATTTVTIGGGKRAFTYHPQNMALYQWFEMGATSSAINGDFSFPDPTVLPASAVPCPTP